MFTSKKTIVGVILIIWAFIFCIPYLIPKTSRSNLEDSRNSEPTQQPPKEPTKNEKEEIQETKEKKITESVMSDKTEDDADMHQDAVNKKVKVVEPEIQNEDPKFKGEIRQKESCIDTLEHQQGQGAGLFKCHGQGRNQYWHLTVKGLLKNNALCIQAPSERDEKNLIMLQNCNNEEKNQRWEYEGESFILSGTNFCLDSVDPGSLSVQICVPKSKTQKWKISG